MKSTIDPTVIPASASWLECLIQIQLEFSWLWGYLRISAEPKT